MGADWLLKGLHTRIALENGDDLAVYTRITHRRQDTRAHELAPMNEENKLTHTQKKDAEVLLWFFQKFFPEVLKPFFPVAHSI
jgi:hypothetical protein